MVKKINHKVAKTKLSKTVSFVVLWENDKLQTRIIIKVSFFMCFKIGLILEDENTKKLRQN